MCDSDPQDMCHECTDNTCEHNINEANFKRRKVKTVEPYSIGQCDVAVFIGYEDDVLSDHKLENDVKEWMELHPEYNVHHIDYEHPGSSGYPLEASVYYTEYSYGRNMLQINKKDRLNFFELRNIKTGHVIVIQRFDRFDGTTLITMKDFSGDYVVDNKYETGIDAGWYAFCSNCGKLVSLSDTSRSPGSNKFVCVHCSS